ncbi:hypothetical protein MBAV_005918 [Candidatus Magnetobacterium bavaricum]|uniref:Uncharacterized protein n=1 Tax=Candidatus Magnetobacterium bavaricum TaxID=29290 RepID=A0A0F3GJ27_9BACT|nr:hypothetical protein MBAV_005918 [Candidatus Magnetobacterium bavaricum]
MGSRGLAPLQGRSEEGAEPPSFFLLPWNIKKIPFTHPGFLVKPGNDKLEKRL